MLKTLPKLANLTGFTWDLEGCKLPDYRCEFPFGVIFETKRIKQFLVTSIINSHLNMCPNINICIKVCTQQRFDHPSQVRTLGLLQAAEHPTTIANLLAPIRPIR